jgi:hypothetical protein
MSHKYRFKTFAYFLLFFLTLTQPYFSKAQESVESKRTPFDIQTTRVQFESEFKKLLKAEIESKNIAVKTEGLAPIPDDIKNDEDKLLKYLETLNTNPETLIDLAVSSLSTDLFNNKFADRIELKESTFAPLFDYFKFKNIDLFSAIGGQYMFSSGHPLGDENAKTLFIKTGPNHTYQFRLSTEVIAQLIGSKNSNTATVATMALKNTFGVEKLILVRDEVLQNLHSQDPIKRFINFSVLVHEIKHAFDSQNNLMTGRLHPEGIELLKNRAAFLESYKNDPMFVAIAKRFVEDYTKKHKTELAQKTPQEIEDHIKSLLIKQSLGSRTEILEYFSFAEWEARKAQFEFLERHKITANQFIDHCWNIDTLNENELPKRLFSPYERAIAIHFLKNP